MHHLFLQGELDPGEQEDQSKQEQGLYTGCLKPSIDDRVLVDVVDQGLCLIRRAALGQQPDLGKALEGTANVQEQDKEYLWGG